MSSRSHLSNALRAVRAMIIVARDRPELYRYLRAAFDGLPDVEVIIDRRIESDRTDWLTCEAIPDWRWQPDVYDELTLRGFVIKRIGEPESMCSDSPAARDPVVENESLQG